MARKKHIHMVNTPFRNLSAEMARKGLTVTRMSEGILPDSTLGDRLRRGALPVQTAMQIRDAHFPGMTIDYLFAYMPD